MSADDVIASLDEPTLAGGAGPLKRYRVYTDTGLDYVVRATTEYRAAHEAAADMTRPGGVWTEELPLRQPPDPLHWRVTWGADGLPDRITYCGTT